MCVFCDIISGKIPCFKVYESDNVLAFLDISQATKGHTLIIPKKHYESIFDLDDTVAKEIITVAKKIALLMKKNLNIDSVNLLNNSGKTAGQEVNHFHLHVIPRYSSNDVNITATVHDFDAIKLANTLETLLK